MKGFIIIFIINNRSFSSLQKPTRERIELMFSSYFGRIFKINYIKEIFSLFLMESSQNRQKLLTNGLNLFTYENLEFKLSFN